MRALNHLAFVGTFSQLTKSCGPSILNGHGQEEEEKTGRSLYTFIFGRPKAIITRGTEKLNGRKPVCVRQGVGLEKNRVRKSKKNKKPN